MSERIPATHIADMHDRLGKADIGDAAGLPADIKAWLAELMLLHGVPLEYLIPNPALLPPESLRFFYLDPNWQQRMIEGALSIGLSSSLEVGVVLNRYDDIVLESREATTGVRTRRRGKTAHVEATGTPGMMTGFLLRSAVVSGWPGMEVMAYANPDAPPLALLRLDRVTNDILLGLIDGLPSQINFMEPPEGLHFGVNPIDETPTVFLRGLGGTTGFPAGIQLDPPVEAPVVARATLKGVLDIAASVDALKATLKANKAWTQGDEFTSADFAIQMTRGAGLQTFQWSS